MILNWIFPGWNQHNFARDAQEERANHSAGLRGTSGSAEGSDLGASADAPVRAWRREDELHRDHGEVLWAGGRLQEAGKGRWRHLCSSHGQIPASKSAGVMNVHTRQRQSCYYGGIRDLSKCMYHSLTIQDWWTKPKRKQIIGFWYSKLHNVVFSGSNDPILEITRDREMPSSDVHS